MQNFRSTRSERLELSEVSSRHHAHSSACEWPSRFPGIYQSFLKTPGDSDGKESACNARDMGSIPRTRRSPGEGNGYRLQYSCLEIPWTEKPCGLQPMGSQRVRHDWKTFTCHLHKHLITQFFLLCLWPASHLAQILSPYQATTILNSCHWLFLINASGEKTVSIEMVRSNKTSSAKEVSRELTDMPNDGNYLGIGFFRNFKPVLSLPVTSRLLIFLAIMISRSVKGG